MNTYFEIFKSELTHLVRSPFKLVSQSLFVFANTKSDWDTNLKGDLTRCVNSLLNISKYVFIKLNFYLS